VHHLTRHGHEFFEARAWYDDRVATAMRLLSDAHKAASFVFPKLYVKMLPLNLEFFRDNYVIHDDLQGCHLTVVFFPAATAGGTLLNDTKAL
jgi:hypothetical protein